MSQENLKSLREEYEKLSKLIAKDLTNWDPRTKTGLQGQQNAAKASIKAVEGKLVYQILKNAETVLVMRDYNNTGELVENAKKEPKKNIVVDSLLLEKGLFKKLYPEGKVSSLSFNSHTVNNINILMNEVADKIDAVSMPTLKVDAAEYGVLSSKEAMLEKLENVLYTAYGTDLKEYFTKALLVDEVLERLSEDSVTVIVVNVVKNMIKPFSRLTGKDTKLIANTEGTSETLEVTRKTRKKTTTIIENQG